MSIRLSVHVVHLSVYVVHLSVPPSIHLSVRQSVLLSVCLFVRLSIVFDDNVVIVNVIVEIATVLLNLEKTVPMALMALEQSHDKSHLS